MVTIIGVMKPRMDDISGCSSTYGRIHLPARCFIQFYYFNFDLKNILLGGGGGYWMRCFGHYKYFGTLVGPH